MSRPPSPPSETRRASVGHSTEAGDWQQARQQLRSGAAPQAAGIDRASWSRAGNSPEVWASEARNALAADFCATLQQGVHGLCFSPYLEGQQPGSQVSEAQIRERLTILQPHAGWVRTFSCTDGHEQTPRIAHELGLKTLVGAWLGTDATVNEREIQGVIDLARAGHADIVAVGNEVMLREDMGEDDLLGFIQRVQEALPGVAVGYVDAYFLFEKHPRITAACDVVMTNCYPFWEGCPRDQALAYMQTMLARTRAAAPGKRVLISETGWPDQGSAFEGSVPSREGAMQYFVDTARWAREDGVELFYFSAFDEAWKAGAEGDVGACWGLWDAHGRPKFGSADQDGGAALG
jgi:glucan 1,3-beta-glucosidase